MTDALTNAIFQKITFKGTELRQYQAALCYTALALGEGAVIAADDIPMMLRPQSLTTPGCAWALMKCDAVHVFERVGRRPSRSPGRNAAWINTYRLTSRELAQTWLRQNGFAPASEQAKQLEMAGLN